MHPTTYGQYGHPTLGKPQFRELQAGVRGGFRRQQTPIVAQSPAFVAMDYASPGRDRLEADWVVTMLKKDPGALNSLADALQPYLTSPGSASLSAQRPVDAQHQDYRLSKWLSTSTAPCAGWSSLQGVDDYQGPATRSRGLKRAAPMPALPDTLPDPIKAAMRAKPNNANFEPLKRRRIAERAPTPPVVVTGPILTLEELRERLKKHALPTDKVKEICSYFSLGQPKFRTRRIGYNELSCEAQFFGDSEPFLVRAGAVGHSSSTKGIDEARERCAMQVEDLLMDMVEDGRIEVNVPAKWATSPQQEVHVLNTDSLNHASVQDSFKAALLPPDPPSGRRSSTQTVAREAHSGQASPGWVPLADNMPLRSNLQPAFGPAQTPAKRVSVSSCEGDLNKEINALIRSRGTQSHVEAPVKGRAEIIKERFAALAKPAVKTEPDDDVVFAGCGQGMTTSIQSAVEEEGSHTVSTADGDLSRSNVTVTYVPYDLGDDKLKEARGGISGTDHAVSDTLPSASPCSTLLPSSLEGCRVYVGNLAYLTTESELQEFFEGFKILSISIPANPRTGKPIGYGFVEVETTDEAERAISNLDGEHLLERKISVQLARA